MNAHRTWLPVVLIGMAFLLILGRWWYRQPAASNEGPNLANAPTVDQDGAEEQAAQQEVAPTAAEYQSAVHAAIAAYEANDDRQAAFDALVAERVPSEYRTLHVNLILLFDQVSFDPAHTASKLQELRAQYPWL